jgi:GMP synthase-like glutamine amidotransferase
MILMIAHDALFPAGTLRTLLVRRAIPHRTLRLHLGDPFPDDIRRFKAIVSLGGGMSAGNEREFPFLRDEASFLRRAVVAGVPVLGIALGARILARALGGAARRAPVPERGWSAVRLTPAGRRDPLFTGLGGALHAFHWHEECFSLPPGAELLATTDACHNQSFRFAMSWGVQFHPEVDPSMIQAWSIGTEEYVELRRVQPARLPWWRRRAPVLFGNFLRMAECVGRST